MDYTALPWADLGLIGFICVGIAMIGNFIAAFINKRWWPLHQERERAKISHEQRMFEIMSRQETAITHQTSIITQGFEKIDNKQSKIMEAHKVNEVLNKISEGINE